MHFSIRIILRLLLRLSLIGSLLLIHSVSAFTQETRVPVDRQGERYVIDRELSKKLELFREYDGFREAWVFRLADSSYVLEIYYQPDEVLQRARVPMSREELEAFRDDLCAQLQASTSGLELDQSGRTRLMVNVVGVSLGFYGWAVPAVLEIHDGRTAFALYLLTSGTSFFLPFNLTKKSPVTEAAAELGIYGTRAGILHGLAIAALIEGQEPTFRVTTTAMLLGSIGEGLAGYGYAMDSGVSAGNAALMGSYSLTGGALGVGTCFIFAADRNEEANRILGASALAGVVAGWRAGQILAPSQRYTRGDVRLVEATELLGAAVPASVLALLEVENRRMIAASLMAGTVSGIALGNRMILNRDFTVEQSRLISVGSIAGALTGMGLYYLLTPDERIVFSGWLTSGTVGGGLGCWLTYISMEESARLRHEAGRDANTKTAWKIGFEPAFLIDGSRQYDRGIYKQRITPGIRMRMVF